MNSPSKCTTESLPVDFMGRQVVQVLPWSIIQLFDYKSNVFFKNTLKSCPVEEIEPDDAVGILVGPLC